MTASHVEISRILLDWYCDNARELPWRAPPGATISEAPEWPYRVWLSEVMLQQTSVAAVIPYFHKFTARWPTIEALANASEEDVMAAWAGLGYYSRARNLVKTAREVVRQGQFPCDEAGLRMLPGLGPYMAAAVAAIAFGKKAIVVDANVERVVARLFAVDTPLPGGKKIIRDATAKITPELRSGDFAQAMMDLGAGICTARSPDCPKCPLNRNCAAFEAGQSEFYPRKESKKARPLRHGVAFWIESRKRVWLVRRPPHGMLGGMRALPDNGWSSRADGKADAPVSGKWHSRGSVRHSFTHFTLELEVRMLAAASVEESHLPAGEWWPVTDMDAAGLPTLFAKAARLVGEKDGVEFSNTT